MSHRLHYASKSRNVMSCQDQIFPSQDSHSSCYGIFDELSPSSIVAPIQLSFYPSAMSPMAPAQSSYVSEDEVTQKSQKGMAGKKKKIFKLSGCRCKKNQCGNNYCSCKQQGMKCGASCECQKCKNHNFKNHLKCEFQDFWLHSQDYNSKNNALKLM